MTRRRPIIEPKRPVYLGCEGESEAGYGQILNDLLRFANVSVHLRVDILAPGAGDPLTRVLRAVDRIASLERGRLRFHVRAILMDSDRARGETLRVARAADLAAQQGIRLIWQNPCHEALLLRHLSGFSDRRPPTSTAAAEALRQIWPEYLKPMARAQLARRINLDGVQRAAKVEPELFKFLTDIRLLP
jgi:hypothetical protein